MRSGSGSPARNRLRLLVWMTVAFLLLNTILLLLAGLTLQQPFLFVGAGLMLLLVPGVFVLGRRFVRRWDAVDAAREELRWEVESLVESARRTARSRDQ